MRIHAADLVALPAADDWPAMVVVVRTEEGLTGLGEVGMRGREQAAAGLVEDLQSLLIGADATRIEQLWQLAYRAVFFPSDRHQAAVLGGIDTALWDLRGQALAVPVHALLGGRTRDYVPSYAHLPKGRPNEVLARAVELASQGWRHLRIGVWDPREPEFEPRRALRATVDLLRELRAGLGDEVELIIDVHTRLDLAEAVQLCREVEPLRPFFVEDPLRSEHLAAYSSLRRRTGVPLAAGEQLCTKWEFRQLLDNNLIDHARIDLAHTGITEGRKIAALCEAHHVQLALHNSLGPVCTAASTHFSTSASNVSIQEQAQRVASPLGAFTSTVVAGPGTLTASDAPGLGITADLSLAVALETGQIPQLRRRDGSVTNW
ncbi:mandelate racemase/muconate lactonizing enzyme family protein [Kribbella turkmenica]|uniref:Mandelate racemase/muconate lactonizing enzyme family protein n=1 Tax=Kribbella turkmenica TaxID=2530375 RepID=A0A4R4WAL3_9ACTN|nr:mandelate racemase/muconate lactonizing enzyme family protein [Kribbella turkmenica]TDD15819.1 mandelate racemase/muconate lactonizing enzyme family protein [Kribbella turkmenica]